MFNQTKVTRLIITVIALFLIASCGVSKPMAAPIASQPQGQPLEVSPANPGKEEVQPQTPLNLTEGSKRFSEVAPGFIKPNRAVGDHETVPVIKNQDPRAALLSKHPSWQQIAVPR